MLTVALLQQLPILHAVQLYSQISEACMVL